MKKTVFTILTAALFAIPGAAKDNKYVAEVNGQKLSRTEAEKRIWTLYGSGVTDEMITEAVLSQAAKKMNISVPSAEVDRVIFDLRKSYGTDTDFKEALKQQGVTEAETRASIKKRLISAEVIKKSAGINVTEADAEKFFNENKSRFATPESARLRQMFLTDRRQAEDMLAALNAGADFAKLAADRSADPQAKTSGGALGNIALNQLVPQAAEAVRSTPPGAYTGIIETENGFYIIQVEDKSPETPADFAKIKDEVRASLEQAEIDRAARLVIAKLRATAQIKKY